MGRVDEALRRSAEAAGRVASDRPTAVADVEELAREPFPDEASRLRPVNRADSSVDESSTVSETPDPPAASATSNALFETVDKRLAQKVVIDTHTAPASREQYRRLAAALHRAQAHSGLKAVMVASAVASEGKSLTAANLALTLSESYRRNVLLVDADFRRPSQHTMFQIDGSPGLMDALKSDGTKLPVHRISDHLTVLPAGRPTSDPMAALTSGAMKHVLHDARETFDWVIVDTPPVGLLADAHLLASMVDGTLLVVRAESTPYTFVQSALEAIGPDHLLGVVLNGASERRGAYGYGYGYGYHQYVSATVPDKTP